MPRTPTTKPTSRATAALPAMPDDRQKRTHELLAMPRAAMATRVHPLVVDKLDELTRELSGGEATTSDMLREVIGAYVITAMIKQIADDELRAPASLAVETIARMMMGAPPEHLVVFGAVVDRLRRGDSAHEVAEDMMTSLTVAIEHAA